MNPSIDRKGYRKTQTRVVFSNVETLLLILFISSSPSSVQLSNPQNTRDNSFTSRYANSVGAFGTLVGRVSLIIRRNSGALPARPLTNNLAAVSQTLEPATTSPSRVPPLPYLEFKPFLSSAFVHLWISTTRDKSNLALEVLIAHVEKTFEFLDRMITTFFRHCKWIIVFPFFRFRSFLDSQVSIIGLKKILRLNIYISCFMFVIFSCVFFFLDPNDSFDFALNLYTNNNFTCIVHIFYVFYVSN